MCQGIKFKFVYNIPLLHVWWVQLQKIDDFLRAFVGTLLMFLMQEAYRSSSNFTGVGVVSQWDLDEIKFCNMSFSFNLWQ